MKDTTGPLKNNRFFFLFLKKRCTRELRKGGGGGGMKKVLREEIWLVTQRALCQQVQQTALVEK